AIVISPVLIMVLIASLVYFIIEVICGGDEVASKLRYTCTFFVFGAMLIARISIEMGDAKALIYAVALGIAAFIAMMYHVQYPPGLAQFGWLINIGLLVLIWWCARKLTWDCTHVDEERDGSDQSVLEAAGLDTLERPAEWREPETALEQRKKKKKYMPGI